MLRRLTERFFHLYLRHYKISAGVAVLVLIASLFSASFLTIDSNQLDLLPDDLPHLKELRRIEKMLGGTGYIILTLKHEGDSEGDRLLKQALDIYHGGDENLADKYFEKARLADEKERPDNLKRKQSLKDAADALYKELSNLKEVQYIQYRLPLDFIKRKFLFFWRTEDLREAIRRINLKKQDLIDSADPLGINIIEEEKRTPYRLDLSDLLANYTSVGQKDLSDDYFISADGKMLIMLIKPNFGLNDIGATETLLKTVEDIVLKYDLRKKAVQVGVTGTYIQYIENYESVRASLKPAMVVSLVGISLVLVFFVRRKRFIFILLVSLVYSVIVTYGATYLILGRLNIITSLFGGVLAGLGIDFGIHFIFRFRDEFWASRDVEKSIMGALFTTGWAAIFSAATTAAAFVVLMFSEFKGFSHTGMLSTYGIVLTALAMFLLTPLQIVILDKISPRFLRDLEPRPYELAHADRVHRFRLLPSLSPVILSLSLLAVAFALYFTGNVRFENDSRKMIKTVDSRILSEELAYRFDLAGDPLILAADSLEEAYLLWQHIHPVPEEWKEYISRTVSIFSFVPPLRQQEANHRLIQNFQAENQDLDASIIPPRFRQYWDLWRIASQERPYTPEDLPEYIRNQFRSLPESSEEGWIVFIYPRVKKMIYTEDLHKLEGMIADLKVPIINRQLQKDLLLKSPTVLPGSGVPIGGSKEKGSGELPGMSEYETNRILAAANTLPENILDSIVTFPVEKETILKGRPFASAADLLESKREFLATGATILVAQFTHIVHSEVATILWETIGLVLIILFISFRNPLHVFLASVPLITGMVLTLGVMGLFDIKFNYFNICVIPIIIGYGINNAIFIFHRYLENRDILETVLKTGAAVMASSLTTLAGWGSLAVADHPGLISMGFLASIGITIMLGVSLALLPALLYFLTRYENWRKNRSPAGT
ncbi:MAG: MMPL family transporter [Spirochaetales bacterium]|nr:MMPL family transporter [Spirochaetales bacterium]